MIRHLHPTDSPGLLQFKPRAGPDEVFTLARALKGGSRSFPLMKYTTIALSPRAWQSCWVETRRASVQAVLRAGPRSGPLAWDVTEMYLAKKNRDAALDVLEQLAFPAGASGARRIFVRISIESDMFDVARSAGYHPVYNETVYTASSAKEVLARVRETRQGLELRSLDDEDQHALFRLYCASVPIDARSRTGQTQDEWESLRETPGSKTMSLGVEDVKTGALQAHVSTCDVAGGRYFSVRSRPEATCSIESLVAAGVGVARDRPVYTVVPSYDTKLSETLMELGFSSGESYDVMVKTLAVAATAPVPGLVPVE